MSADVFIIVMAVCLGTLRLVGIKHAIFQATAHLFVGGLFGAWFVNYRRFYLIVAVSLSVLELLCFLLLR